MLRGTTLTSADAPGPRRGRALGVALLLLVPIGLYALGRPGEGTWLGQACAWGARPLQSAAGLSVRATQDLVSHYLWLVAVAHDNDELRKDNERLRSQLTDHDELARQNVRLAALLEMQKDGGLAGSRGARVIAAGAVPSFRSVRLDRGRNDGVAPGDAVVVAAGLVGRVAVVGTSTADVLLLVDAGSSVDAVVQRSRARVRVRGEGSDRSFRLESQYLERAADVQPGDLLLTSGLGHTFPKGLAIGRVAGVERRAFGLYQQAMVQPSVDVSMLEEVLVVPGQSTSVRLALEAIDGG